MADRRAAALGPALVAGRPLGGDMLLAFVTSSREALEARAEHLLAATDAEFGGTGLKAASRIRLNKLATVHRALVRRRLRRIGPLTRAAVDRSLRYALAVAG